MRAPNAIESYLGLNLPTPADGYFIRDIGNVNLSPERITTAEIGFHDESTLYHQADVTFYANWLQDIIFLDDVTPTIYPFSPGADGFRLGTTGFVNLDPQFFGYGVEADVSLFPVDGLEVGGGLAVYARRPVLPGASVRLDHPREIHVMEQRPQRRSFELSRQCGDPGLFR